MKLLQHKIVRKYMELYGQGRINFDSPKNKEFLEVIAGELCLIKNKSVAMAECDGLDVSVEEVWASIAIIGAAFKEFGEMNLRTIRGQKRRSSNESDDDDDNSVIPINRVCH